MFVKSAVIIKVSKVTETLKIRQVNALDIRKDCILEIRRFSRAKPRESVGEIKQDYLSQAFNSVNFIHIKKSRYLVGRRPKCNKRP